MQKVSHCLSIQILMGLPFVLPTIPRSSVCLKETSRYQRLIASASDVDAGDFRRNKILKNGFYMLILTDGNLWVKNRRGYSYGHTRRDVMIVKNGRLRQTDFTL